MFCQAVFLQTKNYVVIEVFFMSCVRIGQDFNERGQVLKYVKYYNTHNLLLN